MTHDNFKKSGLMCIKSN